jgi:hypothetical protein
MYKNIMINPLFSEITRIYFSGYGIKEKYGKDEK